MDAWETILSFWGKRPVFRGELSAFIEGNMNTKNGQILKDFPYSKKNDDL